MLHLDLEREGQRGGVEGRGGKTTGEDRDRAWTDRGSRRLE